MQNNIANLFISLQQQIAGLKDPDNKAYFPFIERELSQLENHNGDNRHPVKFPCVLIDFDLPRFENVGENLQTTTAIVRIRLGFPPYSSTSSITPAAYRDKALYFWDLEQILHQALEGQ